MQGRLIDSRREEIDGITKSILDCALHVHRVLGCGFLEKVYENALAAELKSRGVFVQQQEPVEVWYDEQVVGNYVADLLIEKAVLVELKAVESLDDNHLAQCLNYLKASGLTVCLLLNFGRPRLGIRRIVNNF